MTQYSLEMILKKRSPKNLAVSLRELLKLRQVKNVKKKTSKTKVEETENVPSKRCAHTTASENAAAEDKPRTARTASKRSPKKSL